VSRAIRSYGGIDDDWAAWEGIFRHFNRNHGKGDVGYGPGEKVAVKLNLVACFAQPGSNRVDENYDKTDSWKDNIDNAPQLVHGLLQQLVNIVGVEQSNIWIGDPTGLFPNYIYDRVHPDFPDVHYWDNRGTHGRTRAEFSTKRFYWSKSGLGTTRQDYVPVAYAQAEYLINFAVLKSHDAGGITVCGKNHYGSLLRLPPGDYRDAAGVWHGAPSNPAYYSYHDDLPSTINALGYYRNRVDFMAHQDIGGKTILYLIDGIVAGKNWNGDPEPWTLPPFDDGNGWPCSLFASMDPVAIDSVALDFLLQQWPEHAGMVGTADYIREAALASNPPSGTFYDPNHPGNVVRSSSLGVHEHWNNPTDKQYSRDLDPDGGAGIELLMADDDHFVIARTDPPGIDGKAEGLWSRTMWRDFPHLVDSTGGAPPAPDDLSGRWKALWDANYLYFLVEVTDDRLVHSPAHDDRYWLDDNVEIFLDCDNSKGNGQPAPNYDGLNDFEFGFRWGDPEVALGDHSVKDNRGVNFSMVETATGYLLEAALPWSTLRANPGGLPAVGPGTRIGLDIHITDNDDFGDEERDFKMAWHSENDNTYRDASMMATVSLSRDLTGGEQRVQLVDRGAIWRYFKGTGEASSPPGLWRTMDFSDVGWPLGAAPFGYGDPPFGTAINDMRDSYSTIFLRRQFDLPPGAIISELTMYADYDDGFIAWINGVEVLNANGPTGTVEYDDFAAGNHESGSYQRFTLPAPHDYLRDGENLIALQGFNVNLGSSDFKLDMELFCKTPSMEPAVRFIRGDSNGDGFLDIADVLHGLFSLFYGTVMEDCEDSLDVDDNGIQEITDLMVLLDYLFRAGSPPPSPFPLPGSDPTADGLDCERKI